MASELLRGAAPYSPRGRMEAPSDWALSTYRMGGARPQLTFPIDTLYSVLCISGDQASLVADASRLAWRILATPQSKRIINIMLQKGPIEELRCNPAGSRDSDYLSLFQAAKIDPEIDAHVNEWLGESDTAIVIEMDSRRRPSREGDIALLAHMGFRTGNAQQEAQEVQEAHEAPHEPDLVMPVGSASAFDDPVAPYWARVSPSAFKEIHLRAEILRYTVPRDHPHYPHVVVWIAITLAHEAIHSMRMSLAYKTQCATTDFVTPRPVRSYMFTAAERGQLDTSRSQLGEGGEFYEEQLFGGFFGFEPCEDEGRIFMQSLLFITKLQGDTKWFRLCPEHVRALSNNPELLSMVRPRDPAEDWSDEPCPENSRWKASDVIAISRRTPTNVADTSNFLKRPLGPRVYVRKCGYRNAGVNPSQVP